MKAVYLDYQATTPCDPRVVQAMEPYWSGEFGNPHAVNHAYGWTGSEAVKIAREQVAALIGARPDEIYFTSGATESANLALQGLARKRGAKNHIITCATEHSCVLKTCEALEKEGCTITYLGVDGQGMLDLKALEKAITPNTFLIALMMVNNEIGVIHPVQKIAALAKKHGVPFFCDAAQAAGKLPIHAQEMNIPLLSLSGHKMYGPKGIGALYVQRSVRLSPLLYGGSQQENLRPGTIPVPLVAGLGKACEIATEEMAKEQAHTLHLRDLFLQELEQGGIVFAINGSMTARWPGNLNLCLADVTSDTLLAELSGVALSSGAACSTGVAGPSHVLKALGLSEKEAKSSLRIGFGRMTTENEVKTAVQRLLKAIGKARTQKEGPARLKA